MLKKLESIGELIGSTPVKKLDNLSYNLFAKLEYRNYSGSIKDRPAINIITKGILDGKINRNTTIVESSSGNFAIALASICREIGLKFIAVIDPNINEDSKKILDLLTPNVVLVSERDETGGYLLTRIAIVQEICAKQSNTFWPNQYENPQNYESYYKLGTEINDHFRSLEYIFIAVSSCGTITGLSRKLKEKFASIKVIAVDVEGSVIFGDHPRRRFLSGIGASKKSTLLEKSFVDDVVIVKELDAVHSSRNLLENHSLFCGASTGAVYHALSNCYDIRPNSNVLFIANDKGNNYLNTIYSPEWITFLKDQKAESIF